MPWEDKSSTVSATAVQVQSLLPMYLDTERISALEKPPGAGACLRGQSLRTVVFRRSRSR